MRCARCNGLMIVSSIRDLHNQRAGWDFSMPGEPGDERNKTVLILSPTEMVRRSRASHESGPLESHVLKQASQMAACCD
jgi:hypothetical protein